MRLTCIVCPNGCELDAVSGPDGVVVTGQRCPRGEEYGREELSDPHRVVTAVVGTDSADWPCLPVKSDAAVPRANIDTHLRNLRKVRVKLPVSRGDTVASGTGGVTFSATRTLPPRGGV